MRAAALSVLLAAAAWAQPKHYSIELRPDFEKKILRGAGEIHFRTHGQARLSRGANLTVTKLPSGAAQSGTSIQFTGDRARFEFEAKPGSGFRWLDDGTLVTMFDCGAWMICDPEPGYRATLRLEIVVPVAAGMRAVAPGRLTKQFRASDGEHFVYELRHAAQSFLFSFTVAKLERSAAGNLEVWAAAPGHSAALATSEKAYRFLREKAGAPLPDPHYSQVFIPFRSVGQEAAGMALMSEAYLGRLESQDEVELMAHEMAHQWWAVLVGIRSWSDFWLNEGISEFMTAAFVEHHQGRAAYDAKMATLRTELDKLRAEGKDRPLHWAKWKDAVESLGPVPYRKGALFLDRLRKDLGEAAFWRGMAIYTRGNAGKLVESRDFQRAMEEAAGRPLAAIFDEGVYR